MKKFRILQRQAVDRLYRDLGCVNKKRNTYTSDFAYSLCMDQAARNQLFLEKQTIRNEIGEELSLADIAATNTSNPTIRRHELMARIRGFENVADFTGHTGEFYTLTTPSRFHAFHHNGKANKKYEQLSVHDGQEWLKQTWTLIRSKLHRLGIQPYGFRVAEPHHDGTPHWHFLLFVEPTHQKKMRKVFQEHALKDMEPGAKKYRFKAIAIDKSKGSAAGYIAKYIAKNLDGAHLDDDGFGGNAQRSAKRIRCWASTWNIRQFQQIGGPSVTVWRELRRLKEPTTGKMEEARCAADAGDWAAYVIAMGGISCPQRNHSIRPFREHRKLIDLSTGELFTDNKSVYGDKKPAPIKGLTDGNIHVISRKHYWSADQKFRLFDDDGTTGIPGGGVLQFHHQRIAKGAKRPSLDLCK